MRYQNNRDNWQQFRSYKHSYNPYDAMTMDKEEVIKKLILPLVMRLIATCGCYALAPVLRRYGLLEVVIWIIREIHR